MHILAFQSQKLYVSYIISLESFISYILQHIINRVSLWAYDQITKHRTLNVAAIVNFAKIPHYYSLSGPSIPCNIVVHDGLEKLNPGPQFPGHFQNRQGFMPCSLSIVKTCFLFFLMISGNIKTGQIFQPTTFYLVFANSSLLNTYWPAFLNCLSSTQKTHLKFRPFAIYLFTKGKKSLKFHAFKVNQKSKRVF